MADLTFRKNKTTIVFALLLVISVSLMVFNAQFVKTAIITTFDAISYPFIWVSGEVYAIFSDTFETLSALETCEEELDEQKQMYLTAEYNQETIEALKIRIQKLEEQLLVKGLLDHNKRYDWGDNVAAEIVSFGSSNYFETIIVNKGSLDGIKVGMPVVANQDAKTAVVGKVAAVSAFYSRIDPLYQPTCRIGAISMESREHSILEGSGNRDHHAILKFIDQRADIAQGDIIVTYGEGSIFPRDIIIGTVTEIRENRMDRSKIAIVTPYIDFSKLEMVFILKREMDSELKELLE